jgi:HK97 family phage prohead protease
MGNKQEQRFLKTNQVEIRSVESGDGDDKTEQRFVSGVGIVYGEEVTIWDGFKETIRAGAFTESINSDINVKSFFNHNPSFILSTIRSDPALTLIDGDKGLEFDSPIPDTTYGRDLIENLERKNVEGASFTFSVDEDILIIDEDDVYHREIVKATLFEVGPVTNPAYPQTEVGVRDRAAALEDAKARIEKQKDEERENKGSNLDLYKLNLSIAENS